MESGGGSKLDELESPCLRRGGELRLNNLY